MIEDARRQDVLHDDRLALDVATQVVGLTAHADPDDLEVTPVGWCRLDVHGRSRRRKRIGLPGARERQLPVLHRPLRRDIERLTPDVRQLEPLKVLLDPILGRDMSRSALVAAPESAGAGAIAILPRDRRYL